MKDAEGKRDKKASKDGTREDDEVEGRMSGDKNGRQGEG